MGGRCCVWLEYGLRFVAICGFGERYGCGKGSRLGEGGCVGDVGRLGRHMMGGQW